MKLPTKEELLARYEGGTYLMGLRDALEMTPAQIRKAIEIILKGEE
jgi:hypothetical protein